MKSSGLFRLGRDAETRSLPTGDQVVELALAYNYGRKGDDGNRPSQWIKASFWGERAAKVAPYLRKGDQVVVYLSDLHIEMYEGKNGAGASLVGRVDDLELVSGQQPQGQQQAPRQAVPQRQSAPEPRQVAPQRQAPPPRQPSGAAGSGFDDLDDDIPFITSAMSCDMTTSKERRMARCEF
jgi:single-strand DNA-binding protein